MNFQCFDTVRFGKQWFEVGKHFTVLNLQNFYDGWELKVAKAAKLLVGLAKAAKLLVELAKAAKLLVELVKTANLLDNICVD